MKVDQKSMETLFSIASVACRSTNGSRKLCFNYFRPTFVDSVNVFDGRLSGVIMTIKILIPDGSIQTLFTETKQCQKSIARGNNVCLPVY